MALLLRPKPPALALGLMIAVVLIATETVALFPLRGSSQEGARSVLYLCGVLVVSSVWGAELGIVTSVASAIAFNYFHVPPFWTFHPFAHRDLQNVVVFIVAGLMTSGLADLARSRAVEASERRQESDLAAELANRMLRADDMLRAEDLRAALGPASQRLAEVFELQSAAIELESVPGDERRAAFPLCDGATRLGTLLVPAGLPKRTLARLRERAVPSLESLLCAALDREAITNSLKASREEATMLMEESTRLMGEQAALRRVATLVAGGAAQTEVFAAVTAELCGILGPYSTALIRYEADGTGTRVSGRDEVGVAQLPTNMRISLEGDCVSGIVKRTGRPARVSYDNAVGTTATLLREMGMRSGVGVPVVVEGCLWGAAIVASAKPAPIPAAAKARLADFTELVATAIANADSRAQLTASRARIVAAADDTRRRLERDLHDGAQQRLISLGLQLRMVEASMPPSLDTTREQLSQAVDGLTNVCEDLREISRGIHPAILSKGGLGPALKTLARRSAIPVELTLDIDQRLPERAEVTAYYIVCEALTNAAKHSRASVVHVHAEARDAILRLSIRDDGVGGASAGKGSGLIGLQDRIETLGGHMEIVSPAGSGTALLVMVPIDGV
jgi:signal transduction histidine kinase